MTSPIACQRMASIRLGGLFLPQDFAGMMYMWVMVVLYDTGTGYCLFQWRLLFYLRALNEMMPPATNRLVQYRRRIGGYQVQALYIFLLKQAAYPLIIAMG